MGLVQVVADGRVHGGSSGCLAAGRDGAPWSQLAPAGRCRGWAETAMVEVALWFDGRHTRCGRVTRRSLFGVGWLRCIVVSFGALGVRSAASVCRPTARQPSDVLRMARSRPPE